MKYLNLNLKRKWYDMILDGKKKEEYREIKSHYVKLLFNWKDSEHTLNEFVEACKNQEHWVWLYLKFTENDMLYFSNGYKKYRPEFEIEWTNIEIGPGKVEWGAEEGKLYFVFSIGNDLGIIRE